MDYNTTTPTPEMLQPRPHATYTQEDYDKVLGAASNAEQRYRNMAASYTRLDTMVNNVKSILMDKMQGAEIDPDVAFEIADTLGITLNKTYDVTITVTFSGTVEIPSDFDIDDLENHLSVNLDTSYYGAAGIVLDVFEDSMEIDANES